MLKLSDLTPDTLVGHEEMISISAGDLVKFIQTGEQHTDHKWYIVNTHYWRPSAKEMMELYLESEYLDMFDDMNDNWYERAFDVFSSLISQIQVMLDTATDSYEEYISVYHTLGEEIEIDVKFEEE